MIERVLICGLAAWRLASLVSAERGPFGVCERFRDALFPSDGAGVTGFRLEIWRAVECPWCLSVWTAALMLALWAVGLAIVPLFLAAAAVAVTVERWARP